MYVMFHLPFSPLPQVYTVLSAIGGGREEEERRRRGGGEEEEEEEER